MADSSLRAHLAETAAFLAKSGEHQRAQSVEAVLAPGGWKQLRDTEDRSPKALPVYMNVVLRDALQAASREFGWSLDSLAEEAYQKVRDGEWMPPRETRGAPGTRAVLPVEVDQALYDQVNGMLAGLKEKAGYRVTHAGLITAYICDELGVERPGTKGKSPEMRFPKALVAHWEKEAGKLGLSLQEIVEGGIHALLDGEFVPERSPYFTEKRGPRSGAWSESERQRLWLPIDKALLADLRDKAGELTEQLGHLVYPGAVIRAILTDRLGEPAE